MAGNGWNRDRTCNRDVLMRIVALLVALAGLADRASSLSVRRRQRVLSLLACGEAEARAFVIGLAQSAPMRDDVPEPTWTDAPEQFCGAAGLAVRLRVLALLLWSMLAQAQRLARTGTTVARCSRRRPAAWAMRGRGAPLPAPDTS